MLRSFLRVSGIPYRPIGPGQNHKQWRTLAGTAPPARKPFDGGWSERRIRRAVGAWPACSYAQAISRRTPCPLLRGHVGLRRGNGRDDNNTLDDRLHHAHANHTYGNGVGDPYGAITKPHGDRGSRYSHPDGHSATTNRYGRRSGYTCGDSASPRGDSASPNADASTRTAG